MSMKSKNLVLAGLGIVVVVALTVANRRESAPQEASQPVAQTQPPASGESAKAAGSTPSQPSAASSPVTAHVESHKVPHYHTTLADAGPLPRILPAKMFEIPVVARAYQAAARIPEVLAQQPCYCWCERMGHGSLVDCFATTHGAG